MKPLYVWSVINEIDNDFLLSKQTFIKMLSSILKVPSFLNHQVMVDLILLPNFRSRLALFRLRNYLNLDWTAIFCGTTLSIECTAWLSINKRNLR